MRVKCTQESSKNSAAAVMVRASALVREGGGGELTMKNFVLVQQKKSCSGCRLPR